MVKSYLKFEHSKAFGTICSASANVTWDSWSDGDENTSKSNNGRAFVAANEEVLTWDLKKAEVLSRWRDGDNKAQVSVICRSETDPDIFAVGYDDGKIRIWDLQTSTVIITFNGHKSAVTHLRFDQSGVRLASGSKDTDVILWDLVGEVGLFKLRGHRDQITSINFLPSKNGRSEFGNPSNGAHALGNSDYLDGFLLTTSKDALIKVWDLATQHCIETHVAQSNGECWALGLSPDKDGCITAGNDGELKVWTINLQALQAFSESEAGDNEILKERGIFYRQGKDRTVSIKFHPIKDIIAIHGSEKAVELWRIKSEDEVRKSQSRKRKRKKEKGGAEEQADDDESSKSISISEIFVLYVVVRTGGKVRSVDWAGGKSGKFIAILISTTNNQLEVFEIMTSEKKKSANDGVPDYNRSLSVDMPGHRSDIRCLALSSDDRMLASASQGSLKIWNTRTQSCLRTLDCGYALCATFLPGDKIVVIGTREGSLEIFDISSSTLIETIAAHEKDIWSLQVHPDGKSLVTGSADKTAKFWDMKVVQDEVLGTNRKTSRLTLVHSKTLKTADDILSVRFSPDGRLLAASTLDSTVKVFFADSLKLFLTLYGHKLPVLSMDISYDSKLIVTSSADKNVRIWGLDFGDCHKAFFAHQDSILTVSFVPDNREGNGHHFFSASKDKVIKYYDGDKFEQIQALNEHHGEIWAMAVAHSGEFLVSASHDKSIRIWQQTDEQIFLEEEREKELEELYENTLLTSLEQDDNMNGGADHEAVSAGKQTVQTLMAGEKIAESLDVGLEDLELMQQYDQAKKLNPKVGYPQRNPIFLANNNISASQYVYNVFQKIPTASLQDALLVLSFSQLPALMMFLGLWASEGRHIPLTCRVLFFMVKTHQKQIVSSKMMKNILEEVKINLRQTLQLQRQELGFNLAGLRLSGRRLNEAGEHDYVDQQLLDTTESFSSSRGKKRGFVNVA